MFVLGIDPGVSRCGFGCLAGGPGGTAKVVLAGVITTDPGRLLPDRLAEMLDELERLIAEVRPAEMALERVLFQANARTAMSVGQASGLALVAAARAGIPVGIYSANEVKLAVTGDGAADKRQVEVMVRRILGLSERLTPPDVSDALALAMTHLRRVRTARLSTVSSR